MGRVVAEYYDPRSHGLLEPCDDVKWDLAHVKKATIVFAYIEKDNPTALGAASEITAAAMRGKFVILVDEKSPTDVTFRKYFKFLRVQADVVFDTFEEGVEFLERFVG